MKKLFTLIALLGMYVSGAWADQLNATLDHTAAVQGGSNSAGSTLDAETHYYNNWGTSGWAAQAYIGFSYQVPDGATVTSATLKFRSNCGGNSNGRTVAVYALNGSDSNSFDWNNLSLSNARGTSVGSKTDNKTVEEKSIDVTSVVNANKSQGVIVFQLGGAIAGATLYGKASTTQPVPSLVINYVIATTYTATFTETNDLTPTVKIYSNSERTVEVNNGELLDGTTYYYRATLAGYKDYEDQFTVDGANPSVNFTMVAKANCSYTIKTSTGVTLASGSVLEGDRVTVAVPRYINVDGTLYETSKESDWYHHTYTITQNNQIETVTYNATSITNVVFYAEAEDLAGATSGGSNSSRTSMGLTAYGTNLPVTNLAPGKYKIYMHGANGNSAARAVAFKNGETPVAEFSIVGNNNNQDFTSPEFTIASAADITLTSEGSNASGVDYFYIQKTGDYTTTKTLGETGFATFSAACPVTVPDGVTVYESTCDGETLTATPCAATVIPANTGVIVKGTKGTEYTFTATETAGSAIPTALTAAPAGITSDGSICALLKDEMTFAKVMSGVTLGANTAYLPISDGAKNIRFVVGGATGIENIASAKATNKAVKRIMNGQLVIEKAGKMFNAAGAQVK